MEVAAKAARSPHISASYRQAITSYTSGNVDRAEELFRAVLATDPNHADTLRFLGLISAQRGNADRASRYVARARGAGGGDPDLYCHVAGALDRAGRLGEAEAWYRMCLDLNPDHWACHRDLCHILYSQGPSLEAIEHGLTAVSLRPDQWFAHHTLGCALLFGGRPSEAIEVLQEAARCAPDDRAAEAHVTLAMALLTTGRLSEGWAEYEWRWKTGWSMFRPRVFPQPQWQGEALAGRTLLIHGEQGYGDTIQFARFLAALPQDGRIVVEVQPRLRRLLSQSLGVEIIGNDTPLPPFDVHLPMMSLPRILGTTLETIPAAPYLRADPVRAEEWRQRLAQLPGLKVGLVWAGGAHQAMDVLRSLPLDTLSPLGSVPGVSLVSLQVGEHEYDRPSPGMTVHKFTRELSDFASTAALVEALDLVISVDTAVAHLAGALGKPVWLLNRFKTCWRWMLDRSDSPWYGSMYIFRQSRTGNWDDVIRAVAAELVTANALAKCACHRVR